MDKSPKHSEKFNYVLQYIIEIVYYKIKSLQ